MDSRTDVGRLIIKDLEMTDLDENAVITLPEVLSGTAMPVTKDEIPRQV